ncbi:hypothetical protein [Magnetococcus sp. PR-3]|uniref:terminase small subunit-like protein n=1 Tax=Magnetococcus sp. PR-3 TaxID=3120355 RepID=UPI002FCE0C80
MAGKVEYSATEIQTPSAQAPNPQPGPCETGPVGQSAAQAQAAAPPHTLGEAVSAEAMRRAMSLTEKMAEELLEITDQAALSTVGVAHAKLRVETRKWLMAKMVPKTWGEKQQVEHTGTVDVGGILEQLTHEAS